MKLHTIFFRVAALAVFIAPIFPASAQTGATVRLNPSEESFIYHHDFDILALDFTIDSTTGDALKAITLANQGSARPGFEYTKLVLWADRGLPGFQGWGYDAVLGEAASVNSMWAFNNVSYAFTQPSQRFFVSLESGSSPDEKITQFYLMNGGENGDGIYQNGEQGIFLQSGVIAQAPTPAYSHSLRFKTNKTDLFGPKAFIVNTSVNALAPTLVVNNGQPVLLSGQVRDRNNGLVASLDVVINGQVIPAVLAAQTNTTTWTLSYTPAMVKEDLTIQLTAKDGTGHAWTSEPYYLTVDSRTPSALRSSISADVSMIDNNALDSAVVRVTVRDENGNPLSQRTVTFTVQHPESDHLSAATVQTDADGKASTTLTSTFTGLTEVHASVDAIELGFISVVVGEESPAPEVPVIESPEFGDLIKASQAAVYYYGTDGKRHVFVQLDVYTSWFGSDFSKVKTISDADLASIQLGSSVPFKPGTMIKVPSIPDVYVIDVNQTLRHVTTEQIARALFGMTWNKNVHDLSEALLTTYSFGEPIVNADQFDLQELEALPITVDSELDA